MNTDLLLQVRNQIAAHPELHNQASWTGQDGCNTTHCIAGWAITLAGGEVKPTIGIMGQSIEDQARVLLDLTYYAANQLFYTMDEDFALELLDQYIEESKNQ